MIVVVAVVIVDWMMWWMAGSSRQHFAYVSLRQHKYMAGTLIDLAGKLPYVGIDIRPP
jgi:hypothetical protein